MVVRHFRAYLIGALLAAAFAVAPLARAADAPTVSVTPTSESAEVGKSFTVTATVENSGTDATKPLTAHLEIVDPTRAGSVDAEDWVPDLNQQIGQLAPGASKDVTWDLVPISGGNFAVYVVTLPESAGSSADQAVSISRAIPVDVTEARTLNAGGALPVAVAVPVVLIVALLLLRLRARRAERVAVDPVD